jgi:hypothetical protein
MMLSLVQFSNFIFENSIILSKVFVFLLMEDLIINYLTFFSKIKLFKIKQYFFTEKYILKLKKKYIMSYINYYTIHKTKIIQNIKFC